MTASWTSREAILSVLFLVGLTSGFFSPWLVGGKVLAPLDWLNQFCLPWVTAEKIQVKNHFVSDCVTQVLLFRKTGEESFRESGFMGWDDRSLGGSAQYANTTWYAFDWTFQLHRFFEFWTAWHLGLAGQFLLAGLGLYFYLRMLGIPFWAALPCAVAYMWNSHFIHWMYHRHGLGGFCWIPWFLCFLEKWKRGSQSAFWPALGSLCLSILGLSLQYHTFLGIVLLGILVEGNGASDLTRGRWRIFWLIVMAMLLTAFMTLPCLQAFLENQGSSNNRGAWGYEEGWGQPWLNALSYLFNLFPFPLGQTNALDGWKLFKNNLFDVIYIGSIPLVAGVLGLAKKGCPKRIRFWCLLALGVSLSPLVGFLYRRVLIVFVLGALCAAGLWLAQASPELLKKTARRILLAAGIGYSFWFLGSFFLLHEKNFLIEKFYLLMDPTCSLIGTKEGEWIRARSVRFFEGLLAWDWRNLSAAGLIISGGLVLLGHAKQKLPHTVTGVLLAVIVAAETAIYASGWVVWTDPTRYPAYARTELMEEIIRAVESGRVVLEETDQRKEYFPPNTFLASGVAMMNGYESIKPCGMTQFYGHRYWDVKEAGRMGITHGLQKTCSPVPPRWQVVWERADARLLKNPFAFPRYAGLRQAWDERVGLADVTPVRLISTTRNRRILEIPAGISHVRIAENYGLGWIFKEGNSTWRWVIRAQDGSMVVPLADTAARAQSLQLRYVPAFSILGGLLGLSLAACLLLFLFRGGWRVWFLAGAKR